MKRLSVSFTLGKSSVPNNVNIEHNNREFLANNVNIEKINENVTYVKQDIEDAYEELFNESLTAYNQKQTRKDRMIDNYYEHIFDSSREEACYEVIVQFGDCSTASCGSFVGEQAKTMLDEYVKNFKRRNPNLYVFNAVLHMDESTPHLHIDFIPFYTQNRKNGLSKGVSMKSALMEQGFIAKSFKENQLVAWEDSERNEMKKILNRHEFEYEEKNAKYRHMTVEEFKLNKDEEKMITALRNLKQVSEEDMAVENVRTLKEKLQTLEYKNKILEYQKQSPYKSFYYSSPDKQSYVQSILDKFAIPYRETENGFEAQECYVDEIRKIEKEFKPVKNNFRSQLRDDIDKLLMRSENVDELLEHLKNRKYIIKTGKFISVKPYGSKSFIRLKSLGENYSEYALLNRINARKQYENNLEKKISETKKDTFEFAVMTTIKIYTVAFSRGALPMKKIKNQKPFSWNNDIELNKLILLNEKINSGATLQSLKNDFVMLEQSVSENEMNLEKSKSDLKVFSELKEKIEIVFENKYSEKFTRQQAEDTIKQYPNINHFNYHNVQKLIDNENKTIEKLENVLKDEKEKLKISSEIFSLAEKVAGGTYVQSLVAEERKRRESDYIPNGLRQP